MAVVKEVKRVSKEFVLKQMLKLLPKLSMDNMETMISLGQKLLKNPEYVSVGETMKQAPALIARQADSGSSTVPAPMANSSP